MILKAKDRSTVATGNFTGHPVRVIFNKLAKKMMELEEKGASIEEFEKIGSGALKRAAIDGDVDNGSVMSGQVAGMVNERTTTKKILEDFMRELDEERAKLNQYLDSWK